MTFSSWDKEKYYVCRAAPQGPSRFSGLLTLIITHPRNGDPPKPLNLAFIRLARPGTKLLDSSWYQSLVLLAAQPESAATSVPAHPRTPSRAQWSRVCQNPTCQDKRGQRAPHSPTGFWHALTYKQIYKYIGTPIAMLSGEKFHVLCTTDLV